MEISFGRYGARPALGAARPALGRGQDLCGFEAAKLRQENQNLRKVNQRLQAAVAQRDGLLRKVAGAARARPAPRPVPRPGTTAPRAAVAAPSAPRAAAAANATIPVRPSAPQALETDRDFTSPSDDALARAWFGGHLGGSGYDGLDGGIGIEDALGLDG